MTSAIEALQDAADRLKGTAVARHATLALALPLMQDRKVLRVPEGEAPMSSVGADGGSIASVEARPDEARRMLHAALLSDGRVAVETFGYLAYRRHIETYADWLEQTDDAAVAHKARALLSEVSGTLSGGGAVSERKGRRTTKR
jgi:hypothetical protein